MEPQRRLLRRLGGLGMGCVFCAWLGAVVAGEALGMFFLAVFCLVSALAFVFAGSPRHGRLLGHLFIGMFYLAVVGLALVEGGGLLGPSASTIPVLPVLGVLLYGRQHVVTWVVISLVTVVGIGLYGYVEPELRFSEDLMYPLRGLAVVITIAFISLAIVTYESGMQAQSKQIEASRLAALDARAEAEAARDQAERASEAKSRFLATMSHELRTPLTAVVGIASWLLEEELAERHRAPLRILSSASQTLLALIDDILDVSRAEAGLIKVTSSSVDVEQVGREVVAVFSGRADDKGLSLTHQHDGPAHVLSDPLRLRQLLFNLVGNAIKYTETGGVVLETSCRPQDDGQVILTLVVRDTGIGIPPEARDRIFESFTQLEQHAEGAGLGLGIVQQIVGAMEGVLEVESDLDVGSTFTIEFLVSEVQQPVATPKVEERSTSSLRVLIADDSAVNRAVLEMMLEQCGCEIGSAENGAEAVAMLQDEDFDLVLMDCRMPVMDGQTATRTIRRAGMSVPVVALTADATPEVRASCVDAGMDHFMTKPITQTELAQLVDRMAAVAAVSQ